MASEAKRGLIRMAANYSRVVTVFIVGILIVPILLRGMGRDGWALWVFLGSTAGIAQMVRTIVRSSMIRELGAAYHSGDDDHFRSVYNASILASIGVAFLTLLVFVVFWIILPLFDIPAHLLPTGRFLLITSSVDATLVIVLAAPFNMYKVTERMIAHNLCTIIFRCCPLVSAIVWFVILGINDPVIGLPRFAATSVALIGASLGAASVVMMIIDRRLRPAPRTITRKALRSVIHVGGWNALATTATMSHERVGAIIMNLAAGGLDGNLIFGLSTRLTTSVRRLTVGVTEGLDAVSARISTTKGEAALRRVMHQSTRLHGLATFPVAVILFVIAEPLLTVWIGDYIAASTESDDDQLIVIAQTTMLIRIMTVGLAVRAISDGWLRILYGAGFVRRYALPVVYGALTNPLLAIVLVQLLPRPVEYTAVAYAYSAVLVLVQLIIIPIIGGRSIGVATTEILTPLLRPLLAALVCSPILFVPLLQWGLETWTLLRIILVTASYGAAYAVISAFLVLEGHERQRFTRAALRRIPGRTSGGR